MLVYTARFLLPMTSEPILDGAIAVEGERLVISGPRHEVLDNVGSNVEIRNLGSVAVMPGLINCHTHLELSWMGEDPPRGGEYAPWILDLLRRRTREDPTRARTVAEEAAERLLSRGTVAVGDVANQTWIGPILARSGLHGIMFHELLGLRLAEAEPQLEAAAERLERLRSDADMIAAASRLQVVLTPHAPHTTSGPLLRALAAQAAAADRPLSIHLAESQDETTWLEDGSGPLRPLFEERGFSDPEWCPPRLAPIEYLDRLGVLSSRTLAVHCVHLQPADPALLHARGVTVIACVRSNARLGVGRPPIPELLRTGIPVALGTDSLASAPDLDLFAEIAALGESYPGLAPGTILRMATVNGARALGLDGDLGSLESGRLARLIVIPLSDGEDDPLRVACSNPPTVMHLADVPWERSV